MPRKIKRTKIITFTCVPKLKEDVKAYAAKLGISVADLMTEAIERELASRSLEKEIL